MLSTVHQVLFPPASGRWTRRLACGVACAGLLASAATLAAAPVTLFINGSSDDGYKVQGTLNYDSDTPLFDHYSYPFGSQSMYMGDAATSVTLTLKDPTGAIVASGTATGSNVFIGVYDLNSEGGDSFWFQANLSPEKSIVCSVNDPSGAMLNGSELPVNAPAAQAGDWYTAFWDNNTSSTTYPYAGYPLTFSDQPSAAQAADLLAQLASLKSQLAAANATITSLQNQLASQPTSNLQPQLDAANATIASLTAERDSLSSQLAALTAQNAATSGQLNDALAANAALRAQLADVSNQLSAAQQSVSQLQASLAAAQSANTQLQSSLSSAQAALASTQSTLASTQSALAAANATNAQLQTKLAAQASAMATLGAQLGAAFGDPGFVVPGATVDQQIANLSAAIGSLSKGQQQSLYKNLGGKK